MIGRRACLLFSALLLSIPGATFLLAQDARLARIAPPLPVDPPAARFPIRIVRPPRLPVGPVGVIGFPQFARAAGMIFSGTVTKVERRSAGRGESVETVAVTFRIESALRGATPGRDLTIHQWIGLWASGQRYAVGERVFLFLYPKSNLGLTSCVGGPLGHFAIDRSGRVLLTAQHLAAFRKDPVLGGKSRAQFSDFARAVRHADEEE
jgi:hypothetical protein